MRTEATRTSTDTDRLLTYCAELQEGYEARTSSEQRKRRGQFFTPASVAEFMAGLIATPPWRMRLLDPGAGTGTLTAAVCQRILRLRSPRKIEIVLYENDRHVVRLLQENMECCRSLLHNAGHRLTYEIRQEDFILSNSHTFGQYSLFQVPQADEPFDAAIMNPPYFKIAKTSEYAQVMSRIVCGQPNIYALFMALAAEMLREHGQLVAITPRSFCSGLYFRGFRRWFFAKMSLQHIHLFESRKDTFRNANVLQESVITKTERSGQTPATIPVTTSFGAELPAKPRAMNLPATLVLDDTCADMVIRIPENSEDARIMLLVESWPTRFEAHGLRVSTGPVVIFRATEFLMDTPTGSHSAPLLSVHNVRPFETVWPVTKNSKPTAFRVCEQSLNRRLLVPTRNYVLLRRFSAKEERRRLTASCFLEAAQPLPYVALENHLNYVYHAERNLTENETYGISALFNSALLDRYFRTLSGNTQVNATEVRTMSFPDLRTLRRIGRRIRQLREFSPQFTEHIVLNELGLDGALERYLAEYVK